MCISSHDGGMKVKQNKMRRLDKFQGCLVASAIGDCLGAPFEGWHGSKISRKKITNEIGVQVMSLKSENSMRFTDDTAMSLSVSRSLVSCKGFDAVDMANRFSKEYKKEPDRGYGGNIIDVFNYWINNGINNKNVYEPALKQFDGSGSYGNGAAMRVASVALYAKSVTQCLELAKQTAMLTHTNKSGYLGAMLLALAVYHLLESDRINAANFIADLKKGLSDLMNASNVQEADEDDAEKNWTPDNHLYTYTRSNRFSFLHQLDVIQELLNLHNQSPEEDDVKLVQLRLGTDVSAQQAVPTAIYVFLRNMDKSIEETLYYSISLGGDTDTIGCMGLALAGAYHGFLAIPVEWVKFKVKPCSYLCKHCFIRVTSCTKTGMAFRAVYVIDHKALNEKAINAIIFKRIFPVIERKYRNACTKKYTAIPTNFAGLITEELQLYRENEFIEKFDSCASIRTPPVYKLMNGEIFPVVAFEKKGLVYACVVFDEELSTDKPLKIFESSGVCLAHQMLENMASFVGIYNHETDVREKVLMLNKYVWIGFPFGVPVELNLNTCLVMALTENNGSITLPKTKGPGWRPIAYKGKQVIHLEIKEKVRALQYDREEISDVCEVYGTILCKADVEDSPEISVDLIASLDSLVLNQMVYHSSVQLVDEITPVRKRDSRKNGGEDVVEYGCRKLRFCPPYERFELSHYKARLNEGEFPVQAFYQMKGDLINVQVMLQLKLSENMKNSFDFFNVEIPFFNRRAIRHFKCLTSSAAVNLSSDKSSLIWNIGTKFPGKSYDTSLEVAVTFESLGPILHRRESFTGLSSYIEIFFQIVDYTYSGVRLDAKSVELYPNSKIKVYNGCNFRTVEYKVWNSHGDIVSPMFENNE